MAANLHANKCRDPYAYDDAYANVCCDKFRCYILIVAVIYVAIASNLIASIYSGDGTYEDILEAVPELEKPVVWTVRIFIALIFWQILFYIVLTVCIGSCVKLVQYSSLPLLGFSITMWVFAYKGLRIINESDIERSSVLKCIEALFWISLLPLFGLALSCLFCCCGCCYINTGAFRVTQ